MERIYTFDELKQTIAPIVKKYGANKVWLFGSYARGEADANSDIDILLDGFKGDSLFELAHFYNDLSTTLNKEVDIISVEDLQRKADDPLTVRFLKRVQKDRRVIYEEQ